LLAYEGVNIKGIALVEGPEAQSILRIIVNDRIKTERILKSEGFSFRQIDVIVVEIPDKPGSLAKVADILAQAKINIDYAYVLTQAGKNARIAMRVSDMGKAVELLQNADIRLITQKDLEVVEF